MTDTVSKSTAHLINEVPISIRSQGNNMVVRYYTMNPDNAKIEDKTFKNRLSVMIADPKDVDVKTDNEHLFFLIIEILIGNNLFMEYFHKK